MKIPYAACTSTHICFKKSIDTKMNLKDVKMTKKAYFYDNVSISCQELKYYCFEIREQNKTQDSPNCVNVLHCLNTFFK